MEIYKTMKTIQNTYVTPLLEVIRVNCNAILAGSVHSDNGITYGGKDIGGVQEPTSFDGDYEMEESGDLY